MGDVVDMLKCKRCGACGRRVTFKANDALREVMDHHGLDPLGAIISCSKCLDETTDELERVRPVFDAMVAAGVDRVLANETMTYMLDRVKWPARALA